MNSLASASSFCSYKNIAYLSVDIACKCIMLASAQAWIAFSKARRLGPFMASMNRYTGYAFTEPCFVSREKNLRHWNQVGEQTLSGNVWNEVQQSKKLTLFPTSKKDSHSSFYHLVRQLPLPLSTATSIASNTRCVVV